MAEGEDRTEAPSARRLLRAREEGNVAISRDASSLAGLVAGLGVLAATWPSAGIGLSRCLRNLIESAGTLEPGRDGWGGVLALVVRPAALLAGPVLAATTACVGLATLLQSGFLFRVAGLAPDFGRVSPMRGLSRILSPLSLVETGKTLVKFGLLVAVLVYLVRSDLPLVASTADGSTGRAAETLLRLLGSAAVALVAVQGAFALIDLAWVRFRRTRTLRMSRQELRDEHKEADGNPQIKARIRAIRRQRARQRMMLAVPKATVVLTNPTHYAVALAYEQGSKAAPRIVAKGADEVAARIRALARENRVPLVSNPPLARALFKVPLEHEVPRELFQAVASVIAYVWRLNQTRTPGGVTP